MNLLLAGGIAWFFRPTTLTVLSCGQSSCQAASRTYARSRQDRYRPPYWTSRGRISDNRAPNWLFQFFVWSLFSSSLPARTSTRLVAHITSTVNSMVYSSGGQFKESLDSSYIKKLIWSGLKLKESPFIYLCKNCVYKFNIHFNIPSVVKIIRNNMKGYHQRFGGCHSPSALFYCKSNFEGMKKVEGYSTQILNNLLRLSTKLNNALCC